MRYRPTHRYLVPLLFGCLLLVPLSSCKHLSALLGAAFEKPTMRFVRVIPQNISFVGVDTVFEFAVQNPNAIGIQLASWSYQLDIDGNLFVKGTADRRTEIAANGTSPLMVPFSIRFAAFVKSLMSFFQQGRDAVPYRLSISFSIDTPIGILTFPFNLNGDIPIPRLPKVEVAGAKLLNLSLAGATIGFRFMVKNEGKFPVSFRSLGYAIKLANIPISTGQTQGGTLAAGGAQPVDLNMNINFLSVGLAIASIIQSREFPYQLVGNVNLGIFNLPFDLSGKVPLASQ